MQPSAFLRRWAQRVDRERLRDFLVFLWKRFDDDHCFATAGSLSYTSMVALVPLTATVLGVVAMFPLYQRWGDALTVFLFRHFVPRAASNISDYVRAFAESARGLTGFGAIGVLVTSLLTMRGIEDTFNRIWRVPVQRHAYARFLIYCLALMFGPLLGVASLAASTYVFSLPAVTTAEQSTWAHVGLRLLPALLEWIAFATAYKVIPNRHVRPLHAMAGGALAAALFEGAKYGVAVYLGHASYEQIYGAVAVAPIFLLWIWVSWVVVLLGATFTAALSSFRHQPLAMRLPRGFEFYALLRLLGRFAQARKQDRGLHSAQLHELEPILTDDLLQHLLGSLASAGIVDRDPHGEWRLVRDLDEVDLCELYEAVGLPVPVGDCVLPCSNDVLGRRAQAALDALRLPLRERMRRSVGSIYPAESDASQEQPSA